jgi:hypothetical protein
MAVGAAILLALVAQKPGIEFRVAVRAGVGLSVIGVGMPCPLYLASAQSERQYLEPVGQGV